MRTTEGARKAIREYQAKFPYLLHRTVHVENGKLKTAQREVEQLPPRIKVDKKGKTWVIDRQKVISEPKGRLYSTWVDSNIFVARYEPLIIEALLSTHKGMKKINRWDINRAINRTYQARAADYDEQILASIKRNFPDQAL